MSSDLGEPYDVPAGTNYREAVRYALASAPPTQVRRPWRAMIRTGFQALVSLCAMLPLLVGASGLDEQVPAVAGAVAVAAGVTRVMALPAVEAFLQRFVPWLAAAPRPPAPF